MPGSPKYVLIVPSALTDGSVSFVSLKKLPSTTPSAADVLQLALNGPKSNWATSLKNSIAEQGSSNSSQPAVIYDDRIVGATYHHGNEYFHAIVGPINAILKHCDATENEREAATQYARQQTTLGMVCYGIASGSSKSPELPLTTHERATLLDLKGYVVAKPTLYPNALHKLAVLRQKYPVVHFIASGNEHYVAALAVQTNLMKRSEQLIIQKDLLSSKQTAVAVVSNREYDAVVTSRSYDRIIKDPLV